MRAARSGATLRKVMKDKGEARRAAEAMVAALKRFQDSVDLFDATAAASLADQRDRPSLLDGSPRPGRDEGGRGRRAARDHARRNDDGARPAGGAEASPPAPARRRRTEHRGGPDERGARSRRRHLGPPCDAAAGSICARTRSPSCSCWSASSNGPSSCRCAARPTFARAWAETAADRGLLRLIRGRVSPARTRRRTRLGRTPSSSAPTARRAAADERRHPSSSAPREEHRDRRY